MIGADPTALRDAATVILVRRDGDQPAVLMGMRGANAAFMPSKYVFPGGAVDPEDAAVPLSGLPDADTLARLEAEIRPESNVTPHQILAAALRELGPGMGDMCLRVCCFLEGIEMTERRLGWSARSGKIVLRLALQRLERHYREIYGTGSPLIG